MPDAAPTRGGREDFGVRGRAGRGRAGRGRGNEAEKEWVQVCQFYLFE